MAMNVKPVPTLDDEVNEIRLATAEIVNQDILPNEGKLWGWMADGANASKETIEEARALRHQIQDRVKTVFCGPWWRPTSSRANCRTPCNKRSTHRCIASGKNGGKNHGCPHL